MDFDTSMRVSASGLTAHRTWLNVLSSNLANANTTRTQSGTPYQRRTVIYESAPATSFGDALEVALDGEVQEVQVAEITPDRRDPRKVFDPGHPDADSEGVVLMPNINPVEEMANLLIASRSYEANLAALNTAKQLAIKAIDIGK